MYTLHILDGDNSEKDLRQESLEFCANVEKHMQQSGAINRFLASIVFVGLPGSGKTTLIARLLKLKGVDEMLKASGSTGVMDGIIAVDIAEDQPSMHAANVGENCEWQKVEFGISTLRQMGIECFVVQSTRDDRGKNPEDSSPPERPHVAEATTVGIKTQNKNTQSPKRSRHQKPSIPESKPTKHSAQSVMATIQRVLSKEGFAAVRPYLENKSTLYLSDTGMHAGFSQLSYVAHITRYLPIIMLPS